MSKFKKIGNIDSVYISGNEIIITGVPDADDENHNCDEMECSSVEHVLLRGYFRWIDKGYTESLQEVDSDA